MLKFMAVGFGPRTPTPGPILFRLRQIELPLLGSLREPSERWDLNPRQPAPKAGTLPS